MDLHEGCLKVNLWIPIIVVVNKVDLLLHGDKKAFLEENFDFIVDDGLHTFEGNFSVS
jgi:hypothetical protein